MIQAHRMHIQNLGLFTTVVERVNDYQRLLQTRPSGQQAVYIQLFKEACDSGIKDVALDRMRQKLLWVQGASETTNIVRESLRMQDRRSLRSKRDRITGIDQILPTKPKLKSNKYNKILDTVINFYKDPNNPQMLDDLTRSYEHYLKLNPSLENEDPEHNLVKCYLFLAFAKDESDEEKAYRYSKRLIEANESLEARSWLDRESRYVLCWAARRLGRFDEADECGKIALQSWPYDPRFYHGLALNAYSWLSDEHPYPECSYKVVDVIQFARAAVENYKVDDEEGNRDVIASSYNNLAYFLALDVTENQYSLDVGRKRLYRAREYLTKLKELVPKEAWLPIHPEYFHTEAYLEYQEYLLDWLNKKDKAYLEEKLKNALREINHALELYEEGPKYDKLKQSIEKALSDISSGRLAV